jgi:hypothetical protein
MDEANARTFPDRPLTIWANAGKRFGRGSFLPVQFRNPPHGTLLSAQGSEQQKSQTPLKIEHLRLSGHFDQVRPAIQGHVVKEFRFIEVAVPGTGSTDAYWNFILDEVRQMIARAISSYGLDTEVSLLVRPQNSSVYEKEVHSMSFGSSDLGKLETPGSRFVVVFAQDKQKTRHSLPPRAGAKS